MGIIYILTNIINNKMYVGQTTKTLSRRITCHKSDARRNRTKMLIHKAINKHGWENFEIEYLDVSDNKLDCYETSLIKILNTVSPNGYNLTEGGQGQRNAINTTKGRVSPMKGRKHSELSKKLISKNSAKIWLGKKLTKEHIKRLSKGHKGKGAWNKGKEYLESEKTNMCKLTYEVTHPNGNKEIITNLNSFCKERGLFSSTMTKVISGERSHHGGYVVKKLQYKKLIL